MGGRLNLLTIILAWMLFLAPGRDHASLANGIDHAIQKEGCLVKGPDCERRSAALSTYVAFRESSLRLDAEGDCDPQSEEEKRNHVPKKNCRSMCAFQIWDGPRTLLTDADACALAGYRLLREWLVTCRGSLAGFASGRCDSKKGKAIDVDRKYGANQLLRRVQ